MSESTDPPAGGDEFMAAATDGVYTLLVADFADTSTAWDAYQALESVEDGRTVEIEGVVVVKRDADGKLEIQKATDHSTRSGLKWGVVGGIALGVIFPPSIIGSAAALGAAGAATGKLRQLHHHKELAERLENSIAPGHSGILALVSDPGRRRDPQGACQGRRHRRRRDRRRRSTGHQGRSEGSLGGGFLVADQRSLSPAPDWRAEVGRPRPAGCT